MAEVATDIVRHLRGLALGDLTETWHEGRRYNRGKVMQAYTPKGWSGFSSRVAERVSALT